MQRHEQQDGITAGRGSPPGHGCDKAIDIIWIAKAKPSFRPLRF
ncbi:hypothetical protein ACCUM_0092 [Candidatus Accumulibacter phosphatis]|uniref:Uncharacterized protein n=1 Tax=Candidatus Accumulibacter phosphatis TaxID=327160 RepID=A0A5S4EL48_9PROT|nr:hypothetical protein ACCUM_0092 [Candidatus Accumulibacter phosphatis]